MSKRYIPLDADGYMCITALAVDNDATGLTKTLFDLSRTTDKTGHFDPDVHTRDVIAAGISGHRALALAGECEDTDLLALDRYFRDAWEWSS